MMAMSETASSTRIHPQKMQVVAPGARRIGGLLFVFSAIIVFAAHAFSMLQWQGLYSLSDNIPSDLGATTCDLAKDGYANRFVCSPSHAIFNSGMIIGGAFLAIGAVCVIISARRSPWGTPLGVLLLLSGSALVVTGAVPVTIQAVVHNVAVLAMVVSTLIAMVLFADSRRHTLRAQVQPLGYGPFVPVTWVMFVVSAAGLVLLLVGWDRPGLWARMAMDVQTMWLILVGLSLIRVSPSERALARQGTREQEQSAKDAAIRDAARRASR